MTKKREVRRCRLTPQRYLWKLCGVLLVLGVMAIYPFYSQGKEWEKQNAMTGEVVFSGSAIAAAEGEILNNTLMVNGTIRLRNTSLPGTYQSPIIDNGFLTNWTSIAIVTNGAGDLPDTQRKEPYGTDMKGNVLLFHFNEEEEHGEPPSAVHDFSGNSNQGNLFRGKKVTGISGSGLLFDGSKGPQLNSTYSESLFVNRTGTFEIWVNFSALPIGTHPVGIYAAPGYVNGWLLNQYGSSLYIYLGSDTGGTTLGAPLPLSVINNWTHLALTWNETHHSVYVNGIVQSSAPRGPAPMRKGGTLNIGGSRDISINGTIDEAAVFNRTLSASEVKEHYYRGLRRVTMAVRSCQNPDCSDSSFTTINSPSFSALNVTPARYFQYHLELSSVNPLTAPIIYNVSVTTTILNVEPSILLHQPSSGIFTSHSWITLNVTPRDVDNNMLTLWFYGDDRILDMKTNLTSASPVILNWTELSEGNHSWYVTVSDGFVNVSSPVHSFTVDSTAPSLSVTSPESKTYRMHQGSTLPLLYVARDKYLSHCWYTVNGQINSLPSCREGSISFNSNQDAPYDIEIHVNDSAGNVQSAAANITVDFSQGVMGEINLSVPSSLSMTLPFQINASSTCAHDWCENVSVVLVYDTDYCGVAGKTPVLVSYGDADEGTTFSSFWEMKCNAEGEFPLEVQYRVHNGSASSKSSHFNIPPARGGKEVYETILINPSYKPGEVVSVIITLQEEDGKKREKEVIAGNLYYPNGTALTSVLFLETDSGRYQASMALPISIPEGTYFLQISSPSFFSGTIFRVSSSPDLAVINTTLSSIVLKMENATTVFLSGYQEVSAGKVYQLKLWSFGFEGKPKELSVLPLVQVYDPLLNLIVDNFPMKRSRVGTYDYAFTTGSTQTGGIWETRVILPEGRTQSDFWELESNPAEVKILGIIDSYLPEVGASVLIVNEGNTNQEYRYEYCLVQTQENPCGGDDDADYASGAKLLHPGERFNPVLILKTVTPGEYYFKIGVYFGTEKSGAAQKFTVLPERALENLPRSVSSGSSSGVPKGSSSTGAAITVPSSSSNLSGNIVKNDMISMIEDLERRINRINHQLSTLELAGSDKNKIEMLHTKLEMARLLVEQNKLEEANALTSSVATSLILLESDLIKQGLYQKPTLVEQAASPTGLTVLGMVALLILLQANLLLNRRRKDQGE